MKEEEDEEKGTRRENGSKGKRARGLVYDVRKVSPRTAEGKRTAVEEGEEKEEGEDG